MFMGYLGRPESTQEVFTSDGFLRSGDVGYVSKVRDKGGRERERERERCISKLSGSLAVKHCRDH